jgi:phenylalanyl-tRNA synthetase alpha chain
LLPSRQEAAAMSNLEKQLLESINNNGVVEDSMEFATSAQVDHGVVVGIIKSLMSSELILAEDIDHSKFVLTAEAQGYLDNGSPEMQVFAAVPAEGIGLAQLKASVSGEAGDVGFKQAMQLKWVALDKSGGEPKVIRKVDSVEDVTQKQLLDVAAGKDVSKADADKLKKRKLIKPETWKTYKLSKGPKFALERKKAATDLTHDLMSKGTWKTQEFKEYNFNALGLPTTGGHLHPLMKVRSQPTKQCRTCKW